MRLHGGAGSIGITRRNGFENLPVVAAQQGHMGRILAKTVKHTAQNITGQIEDILKQMDTQKINGIIVPDKSKR